MGNARTIPSNESKSVVTYTILSDGTEVSRTYNLLSIQVQKELNRVPSATIIFVDGDPSKETFDLSNQPDFEPGKELEIKAGYRSDEETISRGSLSGTPSRCAGKALCWWWNAGTRHLR